MSAYKALSSKEGFSNLTLTTKQLAVLGEAFPNLASALTAVSTAAASAGGGFASLAAGASAAMGTILPLIAVVAALGAGYLISFKFIYI